jgi:hypothetical protein
MDTFVVLEILYIFSCFEVGFYVQNIFQVLPTRKMLPEWYYLLLTEWTLTT